MIQALLIILFLQLLGEVLSHLALPFIPGPVLGMLLMLALVFARPAIVPTVLPTARGLLSVLSLLFVPAGVGVVTYLGTIAASGAGIAAVLIGSTVVSIALTALTYKWVANLMGVALEAEDE
ncbi:CidA/LrgA family protein [Paracoccaceae bacterium GXU_MW_L88]